MIFPCPANRKYIFLFKILISLWNFNYFRRKIIDLIMLFKIVNIMVQYEEIKEFMEVW